MALILLSLASALLNIGLSQERYARTPRDLESQNTLSMISKGQTVRDARQILLPTKGQGLGSLKKIGDKVKAQ